MTKEKFLTVRWNNILALGLGFPALIYVIVALSTSLWLGRDGMIGLAIIGALYWLIVENHTAMRFAWLRKNSAADASIGRGFNNPLTRMVFWAFNAVFWIFLLPFLTPVAYSTGFIAFTVIICMRLAANLYSNNILKPEQFEGFPFRIPWINVNPVLSRL